MKLALGKGPLYMQVHEILKKRIIHGEYPIGSLIPPEPKLKDEFKVSIITIRRAVEELALGGYVVKKSGVGTRVLENNAIAKLSTGKDFTGYLLDKGHELRKEFIDLRRVDVSDHPILGNYFSTHCHCIERIYYLNDQPYIHFEHYISETTEISDGIAQFDYSLYDIMYEQGIEFQRFKDEFSIETPSKHIADMLKIEQKPLLNRVRYTYDINEELMEYSVAHYNTDIHKYIINFNI